MTFTQILLSAPSRECFRGLLYWLVLPLIPFIVAEQLWPVGDAPRWRDYGMNLLISFSTVYLSLPLGIVAGLLSAHARPFSRGSRFHLRSTTLVLFRVPDLRWKS